MSAQVVPLAVARLITVTFLTNGNIKPAEILIRLRAQFSKRMLSRTWVNDWPIRSWKHAETTPSTGKVMASIVWDSQGVLFIDSLTEQ
jgi:hypothetical protein